MIKHLWIQRIVCLTLALCFNQVFGQQNTAPSQTTLDLFDSQIRSMIEQAISESKLPGCVVGAGNSNGLFYKQAFGQRSVDPAEAMTIDTVFDMASITKPVATATAIMQLIERGELNLTDKVTAHFPEFAANDKDPITIEHLLLHTSGLIPDNPLADYLQGPEIAWQKILNLKLSAPIGTAFKYSDVNFIVLGKIVEKISGKTLNEYTKENIFDPLHMSDSGYLPDTSLQARCAPTEKRNDQWIRGQVHDPRAFHLGGVAGHAGLFSTLEDLSLYAKNLLETKNGSQHRILWPETLEMMTRTHIVSNGLRGLGWDKRSGFSINRGDLFSDAAYGHGGFTGTVLWIDPGTDLFFVFLSNRVHPDGKGSVNPLAGQIANQIVASFGDLRLPTQPATE